MGRTKKISVTKRHLRRLINNQRVIIPPQKNIEIENNSDNKISEVRKSPVKNNCQSHYALQNINNYVRNA